MCGRCFLLVMVNFIEVISPLNALIRDQIVKIREVGLNVCVFKGDRVTSLENEIKMISKRCII